MPRERNGPTVADSSNPLEDVAMLAPAVAAPARASAIGDGAVFAGPQEAPPFPEGIAVDHELVYVAGPAAFGTNGGNPSEVRVFHRVTGALRDVIPLQGEALDQIHGVVGMTVDAQRRAYVVSNQLGIVRLTPHGNGYRQDIFSRPLPELFCVREIVAAGLPCSLPNDITFGPDGYLYESDSFQSTIFRMPPGGGPAEPWFHSDRLAGSLRAPFPVGVNGIKVSEDGAWMYLAVTSTPAGTGGAIYRLPFVDAPDESRLELVHAYTEGEAPDGIALGASGRIYVALQRPSAISVLGRDGAEVARLEGPRGSDIAYDAPANMEFDERGSLLVTNHALFTGNPASFAVLRVFVDDRGAPARIPHLP